MPWVETQIKYEGAHGAAFTEAATKLDDMAPPLTLIGENVIAAEEMAFKTQGASADKQWGELKPRYRKWKNSKGPGVPILVGLRRTGAGTYAASGQMKKELTDPAAIKITKHTMSYTPVSNIAGLHQTGTERMIARPPVRITLRQLGEWDEYMAGWLDSVLVGAKL